MKAGVSALLAWYAANQRPLPWRLEGSAYRTLVSELMCQQTRIDTVLPYFARFMDAFPTVEALAAAPTERVLELWSGLGYYSRARNLQRAAQAVVAAGGFPRTVDGLRALAGVGPYTAGAIASIAFGVDAPVVDGNVERVLSRLYAERSQPKPWFWARAGELLPAGRAGDFNQALMELGALVCTPRAPKCLLCPLRDACEGRGDPEAYPERKPKKAVPRGQAVAARIERNGNLLLARRPEGGLLGGLWELPGGDDPEQSPHAALLACVRTRLGVGVKEGVWRGAVSHTFTHLHLETTVFTVTLDGEPTLSAEHLRWVPLEAVDAMALSTLARKTLRV